MPQYKPPYKQPMLQNANLPASLKCVVGRGPLANINCNMKSRYQQGYTQTQADYCLGVQVIVVDHNYGMDREQRHKTVG